jgi:hypothetical protein
MKTSRNDNGTNRVTSDGYAYPRLLDLLLAILVNSVTSTSSLKQSAHPIECTGTL